MELLGQTVLHKKYGTGVIKALDENRIWIQFEDEQKLFLFPEAFQKFLIMKNDRIQKNLEKINEEQDQDARQERKKKEKLKANRDRIYSMKIPKKSQAVYNVSRKLLNEMSDTLYLESGQYLSGKRKGKPREVPGLQPNSCILLTQCRDGQEEKERRILGVAMVSGDFWGSECNDGKIRLHKEYIMLLPENLQCFFWNSWTHPKIPATWGNIPFKYLENDIMEQILQEIRQNAEGTELEELSQQFYHYFCKLNRII